ncbi:MAG: hypothetical protein UDD86_04885 [Sodaliphilus sp.]|nr:hypothetical protein [Sodaliphilus sp.]
MKRIVLILVMAVAGLCGTVEAQTFRDRSGSYTGRIEASGTVRDRSGTYVGRIEASGTVRDRSGSYMGKFEGGVNPRRAAAILFFKLFW